MNILRLRIYQNGTMRKMIIRFYHLSSRKINKISLNFLYNKVFFIKLKLIVVDMIECDK